jgi:tetratricopeptide (TPR) repeat protein
MVWPRHGRIAVLALALVNACATAAPPSALSPDFEAFVSDQFDFDDPIRTEARFLALAQRAGDTDASSEFLTQAARAQGVQDRLDEAHATLSRSGAENARSPRLRARHALERGRLLRRAGDREGATQSFTRAYAIAVEAREDALAADAAHMMALISPPDEAAQWVGRGLEIALASERPTARAWVGTISYNWAMALSERGDHAGAASYLARSLASRQQHGDIELQRATERALAQELALSGSPAQARAILERLLREERATGADTSETEAALAALP